MTATAHAPAQGTTHPPGHEHAPHRNYVMIWGILVVLLMVSVAGPIVAPKLGHIAGRWVMLSTAFGVALVKAYMVAKNFMHLDIEKPIVHWMLVVALALMVLLYGALAPDVQKGVGQSWKKDAGFHHSFTTSKPIEPGEHHEGGTPEQKEHDKP
jgi:caa(3)-type oxidase subunit IV